MANCVFGWPIWSDDSVSYTPALSGGSWQATLPLTNLKTRYLGELARSADALAASTKFTVDLGVARAVRVLALPYHNLSTAATVRWKGGTTSGGAEVYDSTALAVSWAALSAEQRYGINCGVVHVPATAQTARYWTCEIVDTANPDGYVDLGRVIIAGGWQPTYNMQYGAQIGLQTDTERDVSEGGVQVFNVRPRRRTWDFAIANMLEDEALANGFDMQFIAGTHGQLMFVFDPSDTTHMHRRSFLCTLRQLSALEAPYFQRWGMPFQLIEEL